MKTSPADSNFYSNSDEKDTKHNLYLNTLMVVYMCDFSKGFQQKDIFCVIYDYSCGLHTQVHMRQKYLNLIMHS